MKVWISVLAALLGLCGCFDNDETATAKSGPALKQGVWRALFLSPGGELPFKMTVSERDGSQTVAVHNGSEELALDLVEWDADGVLRLGFQHYESVITARLDESGERLRGEWTKVVNSERTTRLPFLAEFGNEQRFVAESARQPAVIDGRWAVQFRHGEDEPQAAVAEFHQDGNSLTGTFLTATGDYRYLAGAVDGDALALSCFDGGHAFLFKAKLGADGHLSGDFWSSDKWHESWTAQRDESASLPNPYSLTKLNEGLTAFRFDFPDLEGNSLAYDDPVLTDKVRLITVFGSWCPNCNDEAPFLQELYERYRERGFEVVGLAFEATGDRERDVRVLKRFKQRHGLTYPILLAGTRDKALAAASLPDLSGVLAYPTSILIDREGRVVAIHTGFSGPGTGEHYQALRRRFKTRIEALL